jgi:predicted ATPase/DNA-binding XRE family transcriptional regulator
MVQEQSNHPSHPLLLARLQRHLSQQELAEKLNVSVRSVRRWEQGLRLPQHYHIRQLVEFFQMSAEELGLAAAENELEAEEESEPEVEDGEKAVIAGSSENADAILLDMGSMLPQMNAFVGRDEEIKELRVLLANSEIRMVTLRGPGGIGKTRLAIELAKVSLADFRDGIVLVSLAAISDHELVAAAIGKRLRIGENARSSFIEQVQSIYKKKHMLLILDNFENVRQASPLIEQILSVCPALKLLVVSQTRLHLSAEQDYVLSPLQPPAQDLAPEDLRANAAVQLFLQRARVRLRTPLEATPENLHHIGIICRALDGLPLAIEMVADLINIFRLKSLAQNISQQRFAFLKKQSGGDPVWQQTLLATIQRSYHLLNAEEQWLFRHLAIFPGGCSLHAARALLERSPYPGAVALDVLISLLNKSMLRPEPQDVGDLSYYFMLDTIREFAFIVLREEGEWETAHQAQTHYYLTLLAEAEEGLKRIEQEAWLTRLDHEMENLGRVLIWLLEQHETAQALAVCEVFGKYCGLRGYWQEELYWLQQVLTLARVEPPTLMFGRVLRRTGYIFYRLRDLERAAVLFQESAAISERFNDLSNLAGALNGQAWVLHRQNRQDDARDLFQRSVEIARLSGDAWSQANALESLGKFAYAQGHLQEAEQYAEESVLLARKTEDRESLTRQISALIPIKIALQQFSEADLLAQECLLYAHALGNKPQTSIALLSMVEIALAQKRLDAAADLCTDCLQLAAELRDDSTTAHVYLKLSQIAQLRGEQDRAYYHAQESLRLFQVSGDQPNQERAGRQLAALDAARALSIRDRQEA